MENTSLNLLEKIKYYIPLIPTIDKNTSYFIYPATLDGEEITISKQKDENVINDNNTPDKKKSYNKKPLYDFSHTIITRGAQGGSSNSSYFCFDALLDEEHADMLHYFARSNEENKAFVIIYVRHNSLKDKHEIKDAFVFKSPYHIAHESIPKIDGRKLAVLHVKTASVVKYSNIFVGDKKKGSDVQTFWHSNIEKIPNLKKYLEPGALI